MDAQRLAASKLRNKKAPRPTWKPEKFFRTLFSILINSDAHDRPHAHDHRSRKV